MTYYYKNKFNAVLISFSLALGILLAVGTAKAQSTATLPQMVIEQKRMELVSPTIEPADATLSQARSSNTGVATVTIYRVGQIQVVAVAPGKTTVSFFDANTGITYNVPVWVQAPNTTGGGGEGYNPGLTQLPQIVMLVKHTQNVTSPGDAPHNINSVTSSNPSVATARTNTANTIQIYSRALGDTFIEFTDYGIRYQVHVWVQNTLIGPAGGSNHGNDETGSSGRDSKSGPVGGSNRRKGRSGRSRHTSKLDPSPNSGTGSAISSGVTIASDAKTEFLGPNGWAPSSIVSFPVWADIQGASWIWSSSSMSQEEAMNGSGIVTFRRRFSIPVDARSLFGSIQITADNAYELSLNGKLIGRKGTLVASTVEDQCVCTTIDSYNVQLQRGENEITVRAINYKYPGDPADVTPFNNPAGVIFLLRQNGVSLK